MLRIAACAALVLVPLRAGVAAEPTEADYNNAIVAAMQALARDGDLDALRPLVEKHPKLVDERRTFREPRKPGSTDSYTALHFAAEHGRTAVAEFLLEHKADPGADAGGGWTALHVAARAGHAETVAALVAGGAKTTARTTARPAEYMIPPSSSEGAKPEFYPPVPAMTPFDVAVQFKHKAAAEYLQKLPR